MAFVQPIPGSAAFSLYESSNNNYILLDKKINVISHTCKDSIFIILNYYNYIHPLIYHTNAFCYSNQLLLFIIAMKGILYLLQKKKKALEEKFTILCLCKICKKLINYQL